jgi:hypothetical protein
VEILLRIGVGSLAKDCSGTPAPDAQRYRKVRIISLRITDAVTDEIPVGS